MATDKPTPETIKCLRKHLDSMNFHYKKAMAIVEAFEEAKPAQPFNKKLEVQRIQEQYYS